MLSIIFHAYCLGFVSYLITSLILNRDSLVDDDTLVEYITYNSIIWPINFIRLITSILLRIIRSIY